MMATNVAKLSRRGRFSIYMYEINSIIHVMESLVSYTIEHITVVPLMRDHKKSPQKPSLKRGLPYLVGNQELKPLVSLPDYPPNTANPF